jgi:hypothetical protein
MRVWFQVSCKEDIRNAFANIYQIPGFVNKRKLVHHCIVCQHTQYQILACIKGSHKHTTALQTQIKDTNATRNKPEKRGHIEPISN